MELVSFLDLKYIREPFDHYQARTRHSEFWCAHPGDNLYFDELTRMQAMTRVGHLNAQALCSDLFIEVVMALNDRALKPVDTIGDDPHIGANTDFG